MVRCVTAKSTAIFVHGHGHAALGGFKFWLGQAVGSKGVNHAAHAAAVFFNEF